jgi:hypothetical protein
MACLLAAGMLAIPLSVSAEAGGQSLHEPGRSAGGSGRLRLKRPPRGILIHLPRGPTRIYDEYPYYYSRGYYPTHMGGYVYYPYDRRYCWGYGLGVAGACDRRARAH